MKKYVLDLRVTENLALHTHYVLLKATSPDGSKLPEMLPGQFAELRLAHHFFAEADICQFCRCKA